MKCRWTWSVILALTAGLFAQTAATPAPGNTTSKPTASSGVAQSPNSAVVVARLEGDGSTGNKASGPNNSASSSNKTENNSTAATSPAAAPAAKAAAPAEPVPVEDQVQQLRDLVLSQSKELQATREQLKQQQQKMQALEDQLKPSGSSNTKPSAPAAPVSSWVSAAPLAPVTPPPASVNSTTTEAGVSSSRDSSANPGSPQPMAAAQVGNESSPNPEESPLQLKVGTAYITPVGFMDFTGVWRQRDGGSGIGTNFAGIPYGTNSAYQTQLSEFRFSMQNSRIGFRVDANVKGSHVMGYFEGDFLGNNPTNVAVTSNSNTFRSRLYWVDWRKDAWEILGGQSWSLATPNRVGVSPLPGDVFYSYNMDVNYQVGMVWGRIPEFRAVYHLPHDKAAFAIALDSPDQYVGGTNGSAAITPPACCSYILGGEADNGTSTLGPPNKAPDVIAKFVADPSKLLHFEVGGLARFFQVYNQTTKAHFDKTGGAGFVNVDFGLGNSGLRLISHNYWSDGGGRYIFGSAPDFIARADLDLGLVHSGSTVDGFEFTHKNTTVFGYWGLDYIQRTVAIDANGCNIGWGYGPSASTLTGCTAPSSGQNRSVQEPTLGFINNFWKNPKYGALSLIGQLSYLNRDPWFVATGAPKNAHSTMAFIDLRYTLPGSAPTMGKPGKE
jgi:hypothetical protein